MPETDKLARALPGFSRLTVMASGLILAVVMLHIFFCHADFVPYLPVDDSLANISFTMLANGRYGFPASPIQAPNANLRVDGLFNFAPWYFAIGAGLSWIFGFSVTLMRALHPLGIIGIGAISFLAFRKWSLAGAGLFALAAYCLYTNFHWPVIRPDIMVSVSAFAATACLSASFVRPRPVPQWYAAGLFVGLAVTSHQISWALVPALILVFAFQAVFASNRKGRAASFAAMAGGGLTALVLYLAAIKFRVGELLDFFRSYHAERSAMHAKPYLGTLGQHFELAFAGSPALMAAAVGAYAAGLAAIVLALRAKPGDRDKIQALIVPPFALGLGYLLSLGLYPNYHTGYEIFTQLAPAWLGGALLAAALSQFTRHSPLPGRIAEAAVCLLLLVLTLGLGFRDARGPVFWQNTAARNVSISGYVSRVLEPLPFGASAWGSVIFGLNSGGRVNLVQFGDGEMSAQWYKPEFRTLVAPDYWVIGYPELVSFAVSRLRGDEDNLSFGANLLPDLSYRLTSLVHAPPYGTSRVYVRSTEPAREIVPKAVISHGGEPGWLYPADAPTRADFTKKAPAVFEVKSPAPIKATARSTLCARVEPGVYLIEINLAKKSRSRAGMIAVTPGANFTQTSVTELNLGFEACPYLPWDEKTWLIADAPGGSICLSQFDDDSDARFEVASLRAFTRTEPDQPAAPDQSAAVPPMSAWLPQTMAGAEILTLDADEAVMRSDATAAGYQLQSPPIPVAVRRRYVLDASLRSEGSQALGILDEQGRWLVTPRREGRLEFDSGGNTRVSLVVANNSTDPGGAPPAVFRLGRPRLVAKVAPETYIDRLTACHPDHPGRDTFCRSR